MVVAVFVLVGVVEVVAVVGMVAVVEVVGVVEVVAVVGVVLVVEVVAVGGVVVVFEVVVVVTVVAVVTVVKVVVIVIEAISIVHSFLSPWYNQRGQNRRGSCGPAAPVPRLPRVIKEGNLSAKELRRIWKDEFLPSIDVKVTGAQIEHQSINREM